ncbi:MAG: acyl-homoserine-lactone synthase [Rhodospirillales bacterium]
MIHVVTPAQYGAYGKELDAMFQLRHRVFKERLGWDVKSIRGRERDAYDDLDPVYFLNLDDDGELVASWRLLPTEGPYMLKDIFAELMQGEACPVSPKVWECSRFSVDPGEVKDVNATINRFTSELVIGMLEYCMAAGIDDVISVYDIRIARMFPRIGAGPNWQKKPQRIGKTIAVAGNFPVRPYMVDGVRAASGIRGSVFADAAHLPNPQAA